MAKNIIGFGVVVLESESKERKEKEREYILVIRIIRINQIFLKTLNISPVHPTHVRDVFIKIKFFIFFASFLKYKSSP